MGGWTKEAETDTFVKYAGVLLCLVFAIYCCHTGEIHDLLLFFALSFTVVSDYFLLVSGTHFEIGLITFIIAQLFHFARICTIKKKVPFFSIILRILIPVAAIAVIYFLRLLDMSLLIILCAIYFPNLLMNFVDSLTLCKQRAQCILMALGFLLFIGCDINVGLYNLAEDLSLTTRATEIVNYLMWAFYLPSQTLLVLSGGKYEKGKR